MKPILGILGGMGPLASSRFYEIFIRMCIERHLSVKNSDFPHLLIDNIPVPDLVSSQKDAAIAVDMIAKEARRLVRAGATVLAMTCNTMHLYEKQIRCAVPAPLISMIEAVVQKVGSERKTQIGLLGSITTMQSDLYKEPLAQRGIAVRVPSSEKQAAIGSLIHRVIAGYTGAQERAQLISCMEDLMAEGCEAILLGCTELPLLRDDSMTDIPLYDSLSILAEKCCDYCFASEAIRR